MSNSFKMTLLLSCGVLVSLCLSSCSNGTSTSTDESSYTKEGQQPATAKNSYTKVEQTPTVAEPATYYEINAVEKTVSDPIERRLGKYTFTDMLGDKYTLTLKSDKTATIESHSRGFSTTHYGSWTHNHICNAIEIVFPSDDAPYMNFTTNSTERQIFSYLSDNEDFLYKSYAAIKAKNPKLRLEVKKVE